MIPDKSSSTTRHPWESYLLIVLFVVCLAWSVGQETVGWQHSISGTYQNGFRQSQTALSTLYLARGGPLLAYETPVAGPPWSIPYEFPLYQYLVASGVRHLHTDLIPTGRFVSLAFFYATLGMLWLLLGELGVQRVHRLAFETLLVVSPLYVFWSRCFMIESTALFLAVAQLYCILRALRLNAWTGIIAGAATGVAAAVVKPTTWFAFAALAGVVTIACAYHSWSTGASAIPRRRYIILVSLWFLLPLTALAGWTSYTNTLKSLNAIGTHMQTGDAVLVRHLYGTLAQRVSPETWGILLHRIAPDLAGRLPGLLLPLLALVLSPRRWRWVALCIGAFLVPFLLFTNLHVVHNYYAYANGIFLLVAAGWAIEGLLDAGPGRRGLGYALLIGCVATSIYGYYRPGTHRDFPSYAGAGFQGYHHEQVTDDQYGVRLGAVVAAATPPDSVVVGLGLDWSSELPLYSDRRALMIPNWTPRDFTTPMLEGSLAHLRPERVGALVGCPSSSPDGPFFARLAERFGLDPTPRPAEWCSLFTRSPGGSPPAPGGIAHPTASDQG